MTTRGLPSYAPTSSRRAPNSRSGQPGSQLPGSGERSQSERPNSSNPAEQSLAEKTGRTSGRLELERKRDHDHGAHVDGTLDVDRAAESLDAVTQPDEPGAARWIGATDPVVADRELQAVLSRRGLDVDSGGVG